MGAHIVHRMRTTEQPSDQRLLARTEISQRPRSSVDLQPHTDFPNLPLIICCCSVPRGGSNPSDPMDMQHAQASCPPTISQSSPNLAAVASVMPSSHLLLLGRFIFPAKFQNELHLLLVKPKWLQTQPVGKGQTPKLTTYISPHGYKSHL